jgi:hypothetical protein
MTRNESERRVMMQKKEACSGKKRNESENIKLKQMEEE